jgi:hypothetical protein
MSESVLSWEERQSLTVLGDAISVQVRDDELALHVREGAPRSSEDGHPVLVGHEDMARLHALLNEAHNRRHEGEKS